MHGQFLIDKISSKNYVKVNNNILKEIISTIKEKHEYYEMPKKEQMDSYNMVIDEIMKNSYNTYYLLNLSEKDTDYIPEFYWLLGFFYDITIIDSKNKKLINITYREE
jgi:hypothetical protein